MGIPTAETAELPIGLLSLTPNGTIVIHRPRGRSSMVMKKGKAKPKTGCVGCKWRPRNDHIALSMCAKCPRAMTIDGEHYGDEVDHWEAD